VPVADYRGLMAGGPRGMTCSSLCGVTLRPPTLLWWGGHADPLRYGQRRYAAWPHD
jgi:hypothetical protein